MRRLEATIAAALALSAGGCAGGGLLSPGAPLSRSAYEARTATIDSSLRARYDRAAVVIAVARRRLQIAAGYGDEAAAFSGAADALARLAPPPELRSDHRKLVGGLRGVGGELSQIAASFRTGDAARARRLIAALPYSASSTAVRHATADMRSHGYAVFVAR